MDQMSEAETRVLDARCRMPTSPALRTAVVRLRALPPDRQAFCIVKYAVCDLPHLIRCAVEAGISADTRWGEHDTPVLCFAAQQGSERALKALLVGRASHALAEKNGRTAAHCAAGLGHTACLRLLLNAGAEVDVVNDAGYTPLHQAAQEGHAECCSLLLALGSNANTHAKPSGETPLITAVARKRTQCVRVLLPASDLSAAMRAGRNSFHASVITGNLECFELMLPLINDVDVRSVAGLQPDGSPTVLYNETPLHLACSFGQEKMVRALLDRGASRTARDSDQRTPLHHASKEGHLGCVRQLLGKPGAYKLAPDEVNAADEDGWTPLHYAADHGQTNLCGVLRAAGARLDSVSRSGHTPLMVTQQEHPANTALIDLLAGRGPAHPPGTVCDKCGRPEPEVRLSYCTGCLRARFCGSACLVAAWPAHRTECQRVQAAREDRARPIFI